MRRILAQGAWQMPGIETVWRDLRFALRSIGKYPGLALVLIFTLAIGIGANTAIFSVVYAVLLKPPPYPNAQRLVGLTEETAGQTLPVSWINFQHWRRENHTFEEMAGFETADLTLTGRGDAELAHTGVVGAAFFRLTGWLPLEGRLFSEADDRLGAAPTVVLTSEFCARMLGGVTRVVGTMLILDGKGYQVI